MAGVDAIPSEVLALIFAETPLRPLLTSRLVCRRFRHVVDNHAIKAVLGAPGIGVLQAVFECKNCRYAVGSIRETAPWARDCRCNAAPPPVYNGGGIFQLITGDGKQDRMLMATELLNRRMREIAATRYQSADSTLVDRERTHIMFMNQHFKPFHSIGHEYDQKTTDPPAAFGGKVTFEIPKFGDFFHDMSFHVELPPLDTTDYLLPPWMFGDNNPVLRLSRRQQRRLRRRQRRLNTLNVAA